MSIGLVGSFRRRRIDVCDECGEDILDEYYTGWIKGRTWDLHPRCFFEREPDMNKSLFEAVRDAAKRKG
jgi:hypothetical protein